MISATFLPFLRFPPLYHKRLEAYRLHFSDFLDTWLLVGFFQWEAMKEYRRAGERKNPDVLVFMVPQTAEVQDLEVLLR